MERFDSIYFVYSDTPGFILESLIYHIMDYKKCMQCVQIEERTIFLERCLRCNILLPSNQRKGIDFDLLLIQQRRIILNRLPSLHETAANLRNQASILPANMRDSFFNHRVHIKRNFIKKFNWLKEKQKLLRSSVAPLAKSDIKSQTIKNRQDRKRYKRRKAKAAQESMVKRANTMILNKSDIVLNDNDKSLLMLGLNFVLTPNWSETTENSEWQSAYRHVRRIEWNGIFKNDLESRNYLQMNSYYLSLKSPPNRDQTGIHWMKRLKRTLMEHSRNREI